MNHQIIDVFKKRRTQYSLGRNTSHTREDIESVIKQAVKHAPSSFNSQSSRAVILWGSESEKLWQITKDILRKMVGEANFAPTDAKLSAFAAGLGTILFFEDQDVIKGLQQNFPLYADNFPIYSEHSSGMGQYAVWVALAQIGLGASLQHYSPLIDADVAKAWNLPLSWRMRSQMPFGSNEQGFPDKSFMDDDLRFKIFG